MENLRKYTTMSDDEESCSDIFAETSDVEKSKPNQKTKENGKRFKSQSTIMAKKTKLDKSRPAYMDKMDAIIEEENIITESANTFTVKQDGHNIMFKYPVNNGQDYFVLQHYKMDDIKNISSSDRWKHASCVIKLYTDQSNKDKQIVNAFNKLIEMVLDRFVKDPKKKVTKHKLETK